MQSQHPHRQPNQVLARTSDPRLRIGDAERGRVVDQLADHHAAGRLTLEEFEDRMASAWAARTGADLDVLVRDLPTQPRPSGPPAAATRLRLDPHARTYLAVIALLWLIWLVTGAGYPWPIWPMLGWGIGVIGHHRGRSTWQTMSYSGRRVTRRSWRAMASSTNSQLHKPRPTS